MLVSYIRYNFRWLPAYLILALILICGIILTGDRKTFFIDMIFVIAQIFLLLLIPNIIYLFRHRDKKRSISGFLVTLMIIPLPFLVIVLLMAPFIFR